MKADGVYALKEFVRSNSPRFALDLWRSWNRRLSKQKYKDLSLRDTFTTAYQDHAWGNNQRPFFSGSGSTLAYAEPYAEAIRCFVKENQIRSIVDIGCGDFTVAQLFQAPHIQYIGIDIVEPLINFNMTKYRSPTTNFVCLDATSQEIPTGELCLIRQVFQHLSNLQIISVMKKLAAFKYIIVTEHYPEELKNPIPNLDKPHGPDIRLYQNSAVYLDKAPFNYRIERELLNLDFNSTKKGLPGSIQSFLIKGESLKRFAD